MSEIIMWCNGNAGFFSAVLSMLTLITSIIAVTVSICTAKLPYKKKVKLSYADDFHYFEDENTRKIKSEYLGMSVNMVNVGNREINVCFLGLCYKSGITKKSVKEIYNLNSETYKIGIIKPTEIKIVKYISVNLIAALEQISPRLHIYLFAKDSEGKMYFKRIKTAKSILKDIELFIRK